MAGLMGLTLGGCASGPWLDNPAVVRAPAAAETCENPLYVPLGPPSYGAVFEKVLDVLGEYFDVAKSNRYDGTIETYAKIAPGFERALLPGSPDCEQRTLATLQTIRHFAKVEIQVADAEGGFFVCVKVFKELEDLPRPSRTASGPAIFRSDNTVERHFEVVQGSNTDTAWIPIGRDHRLEQVILQRIKRSM
jgi:hypothetical protein